MGNRELISKVLSHYLFWLSLIVFVFSNVAAAPEDLIYGYECHQSRCRKVELNEQNFESAISFPVCRIFCGDDIGTLWPKPTGRVQIEPLMRHIDHNAIDFKLPKTESKDAIRLWNVNKERFMQLLNSKVPDMSIVKKSGYPMLIVVDIPDSFDDSKIPRLELDSDESYSLVISSATGTGTGTGTEPSNLVKAEIKANSFFGARHGLETLSQLIVYDDIRREVQAAAKVEIEDAPMFKWRGLLLDTARNFFSVKSIKRTLDGMAMVKLNTFHWHITDSHSFPFEMKSQPELYKLGAYSQRKVYTQADIADIVEYGRVRGIRVMPEFDAPAHVGEGWQNKNMTACFNAQPWNKFCVEPPCGQLDPTVDELYPVLEDIYREMFELFDPDIYHMGGDEVSVDCWKSSERIRNWMLTVKNWGLEEADFMRLWGHFQTHALERVDKVAKTKNMPIILWTSRLTEVPFIDEFVDKARYIIQIWTTGRDTKIQDILKRGYRIIISNYDALYFDCGGASWISDGNNWCSPYIGWQKVYDNSIDKIAGDYKSLVLGAEAAIWSEQIDEFTLDARFWPRASALAERLWTNPKQGWRKAESRLLVNRERLVENGLGAEALQPEWCRQNENECPIDAYNSGAAKAAINP